MGTSTEGSSFDELCDTPKSTSDYLAMVENRDGLVVTGVPRLIDIGSYAVQRFCNLVDVLHDRDIRTHFYSEVDVTAVAEKCTGLDIDRTISRLSQLGGR